MNRTYSLIECSPLPFFSRHGACGLLNFELAIQLAPAVQVCEPKGSVPVAMPAVQVRGRRGENGSSSTGTVVGLLIGVGWVGPLGVRNLK